MVDAEAELISLEERRCVAIDTRDLETLAALVTPRYIHVHASGRIEDRATWLDNLRHVQERQTLRAHLKVHLDGSIAIMVGEIVTTMRRDGDERSRRLTGIAVQAWLSTSAGWRLASFQFTPTHPAQEIP